MVDGKGMVVSAMEGYESVHVMVDLDRGCSRSPTSEERERALDAALRVAAKQIVAHDDETRWSDALAGIRGINLGSLPTDTLETIVKLALGSSAWNRPL